MAGENRRRRKAWPGGGRMENRWRSVPQTDMRTGAVSSATDAFLASMAGLTYPGVPWKADSLSHRISRSG